MATKNPAKKKTEPKVKPPVDEAKNRAEIDQSVATERATVAAAAEPIPKVKELTFTCAIRIARSKRTAVATGRGVKIEPGELLGTPGFYITCGSTQEFVTMFAVAKVTMA